MTDDFVFAWEGASAPGGKWAHLRVVRLSGEEEASRPFRYELHLAVKSPIEEPEPDALVGKRATLRIATLSSPQLKVVHGIITEAEDVAQLSDAAVYRVVLEPALSLSRFRKRCRIFLDKTTRQIVEAVLGDAEITNRSGGAVEPDVGALDYAPAADEFTWRISDPSRLDEAKARPFCVQYNESDLAFVSRLLEEEGISYHFEQGDGVCLLVLSDADAGRPRLEGVVGPGEEERRITNVRQGARLRAHSVVLGEYSWKKPALSLAIDAKQGEASDLVEHTFPGGHLEHRYQGEPLARARAERLHTEALYATARGRARVLSAGTIFTLEHDRARYEGEYLVTKLRVRGHQEGVLASSSSADAEVPWEIEIECASRGQGSAVAESKFRPARRTPKPRIFGAQTAFVTAEPGASSSEVNVNGPDGLDIGCVRLKFHWDTEQARLAKEPSSSWVRVSQAFAGPGQGGVMHPRVGVEVIVEFEEGDPDRPIVSGRVYNGANRPPKTAPTHSTLFSLATPGGAVHNEISFVDTAGGELVYMNAGKNMTADVGNDRRENVGVDALMKVGANDLEQIGANNTTTVGADDSLTVGADQNKAIGGSRSRVIGANRTKMIGASETRIIGADHTNVVGGALDEKVGAAVTESYGATRTSSVAADWTEHFSATKTQSVAGIVIQAYGGNHTTTVGGFRTINVGALQGVLVGGSVSNTYNGPHTVNVGAVQLNIAGGPITVIAPSIDINAPLNLHLEILKISLWALKGLAYGCNIALTGVAVQGLGLSKGAGGASLSVTGADIGVDGPEKSVAGAKLKLIGALIHTGGLHIHS